MEAVSGYKQLEVERFSRDEVLNLLHYYRDSQWITKGRLGWVGVAWGVVSIQLRPGFQWYT